MSKPPSPTFNEAASYLSKASSLYSVSSATKLELYGLFKYVTVSASPNTPRPSLFDMTGRAKWDAWSMASKTYREGVDAENRYLAIAQNLGWEKGTALVPESERDSEVDLDSISDENSSVSAGGSGRGGGPMGGTVSSMAMLHEEIDLNTLHGLAVSNDSRKLEVFLQENPNTDINGLNEHGYTSLHLAADRGNVALVEALLSQGADPSIKDSDDFTAPELARIAGHDEIGIMLDKAMNQAAVPDSS